MSKSKKTQVNKPRKQIQKGGGNTQKGNDSKGGKQVSKVRVAKKSGRASKFSKQRSNSKKHQEPEH